MVDIEIVEGAPEEYKKFVELVEAVAKDYCKSVTEKNKSAGVRARKALGELKTHAVVMRKIVLESR